MTIYEAIEWANNIDQNDPRAQTAITICALRGQYPFDFVNASGMHIPNYQAVLAEAQLLKQLGETS